MTDHIPDARSKLTLIEQMVDPILTYCDERGWVCMVRVQVHYPNGKLVVTLDAHGEHELASDQDKPHN